MDYGKSATRKIIEDMAPYKPTIICGLAYGIDIQALITILQYDLQTIAFMGSSVDKIYPSAHASVAKDMCFTGGLASEYLPGSTMHQITSLKEID